MQEVTITQITPPELEALINNSVKKALSDLSYLHSSEPSDKWFDLDEFCLYDPSKREKQTIYGLISRNEIPHYKKGKKLYFLKSEIDAWLKTGRKKTVSEIEAEAEAFVSSNKRRGRN